MEELIEQYKKVIEASANLEKLKQIKHPKLRDAKLSGNNIHLIFDDPTKKAYRNYERVFRSKENFFITDPEKNWGMAVLNGAGTDGLVTVEADAPVKLINTIINKLLK